MSKQKKRKWSDLSEKEIREMRALYNEYQSHSSIATKYGIARTTLQYHVDADGWYTEREMKRAELFTTWSSTKKEKFVNMSNDAAKIIMKSLNHLANRQEPPTTREAQQAVSILESLDRITRLDEGKPTEITEEKVMDLKDIEVIAEMVPFKPKVIEPVEDEEEDDKKSN